MKQTIILFILVMCLLKVTAQDSKKILFIGNSITYYNNMPQTFEAIANSKGDNTNVTMYAPGGTGFVHHVNDNNVWRKFRDEVWDFVVLQPGSSESVGQSATIAESLVRAQRLKDSIVKYSPCVKILYYEISYGVWGSTAANLQTYNNTMDIIKSNNEILADGTNSYFAPVGEAFRTKWNGDQTDMLWGSTGDIHPNAKGSYIAACVFYSSIFQKASLGTTEISSLSQVDATAIQTLADDTVLNNLSDWRINVFNQFTNFEYNQDSSQISFTNLSLNTDAQEWDFGDGSSSTSSNPTHLYTSLGDFDITLTTHKGNCSETITKTITVSILGESDYSIIKDWNIYPNPTSNTLHINVTNDNCIFSIFDYTNKLIKKTNNKNIDVSTLAKGIYFIQVNDLKANKKAIRKWIKL